MAVELVIDGGKIDDYDGFVREFNHAYLDVFDGPPWDGEISDLHELLDAVEEVDGERLIVRWLNSQRSRYVLGHEQMAEFWSRSLAKIPKDVFSPDGFQLVHGWRTESLEQAKAGLGRTLFEYLVWQIRGDEVDADEDGDQFPDLTLE